MKKLLGAGHVSGQTGKVSQVNETRCETNMDLFGRVIGRQHMFYVSALPVAFWPMLWWSMLVSPTTSSPETVGFHTPQETKRAGRPC